ncbi:Ribosome-binding factor [Saliniradius amylolyticus]|uniref:Ribosome-binding factor A n=1 Tax=Saliniradius amylolyticus TaxID=2183582 RepID=A0A2S2E1Q5_9ALTE|nr:30S ribosome-binding factor RbfA [Saliniradius amylolyticus]AWL11568.1 Ribosome-binding factor [Saliniradius amylolyticus]
MAREFSRTDRVAQVVHQEVASILQFEMKDRDPRLGLVTVSGAEVSKDLAHAKIYVTLFESDDEKVKEQLAILEENKGFIRSLLSKRLTSRTVPALRFLQDTSLTEGVRISSLVSKTVEEDRERARKAGRDPDAEESEES